MVSLVTVEALRREVRKKRCYEAIHGKEWKVDGDEKDEQQDNPPSRPERGGRGGRGGGETFSWSFSLMLVPGLFCLCRLFKVLKMCIYIYVHIYVCGYTC